MYVNNVQYLLIQILDYKIPTPQVANAWGVRGLSVDTPLGIQPPFIIPLPYRITRSWNNFKNFSDPSSIGLALYPVILCLSKINEMVA